MPYYKFYEEFEQPDLDIDQDGDFAPAGEFHYESAFQSFDASALSGVPAAVFELLREAGVTEMRVTYDGGNDEGFAHADDMWLGEGVQKAVKVVAEVLATPENLAKLRDAAATPHGSHWFNAAQHYQKSDATQTVMYALDELAHEMASQLLGEGYGTGEYELYGAVTVSMEDGTMNDDPQAQPPAGK